MTDETAPTPDFTDDVAARAAALEARIAEIEASTRARLIHAELKSEALRAGMIDLDGIKLADTSTVTIDAQGNVAGAAPLMASLRKAKPWLFNGPNSSHPANPPPPLPTQARRATEMTYTEWQAARREMLRRR
jgi:hypothetical protein